ncbi:hypothetical protein LINGRAHAP2_LOCUS33026 [Linum grandiflorum]
MFQLTNRRKSRQRCHQSEAVML